MKIPATQSLAKSGSLTKKADPPAPSMMYPGDATNPEALKKVLGLGLTGLGVGAAGRSLLGLRDMYAKAFSHRPAPAAPAIVEIGVPTVTEDDEEEDAKRNARMRSPTLFKSSAGRASEPVNTGMMPDAYPEHATASPLKAFVDFWKGRFHENVSSKPWFMPAAFGAGVGGLYGGYKAVDSLLDSAHRADKDRELEDAKNEYRKALVEQYSPVSPAVKRADHETTLSEDLDTLYELNKQAMFEEAKETAKNVGGTLLGGYGILAGLLAGGTGLAAYNWTKSRSPEERLAKAIKQREKLRWSTRPPEIYAVTKPLPVRMSSSQTRPKGTFYEATPEDQEAVQKISSQKIASLYR